MPRSTSLQAKSEAIVLPVDAEEMTMVQAQESLTPIEQKAFKEIQKALSQHVKDTIWWYWELGCKIQEIFTDSAKRAELYGKNVIGRLARSLGLGVRVLYNASAVVKAFGTKKAFTEYVKMSGEGGNSLHWTHLVLLAGVTDESARGQLAATTLEQGWSVEDLASHIKTIVERKTRGVRAAKSKVPGSVKGFLSHVVGQTQKFIGNLDNAWHVDSFDIVAEIEKLPADSCTEKLLAAMQTARGDVSSLYDGLADLMETMDSAMSTLRGRIEEQDAAEEEDEEEEESEDEIVDTDYTDDAEEEEEEEEEEDSDEDLESEDEEDEVVNLGEVRSAATRAQRSRQRKRR